MPPILLSLLGNKYVIGTILVVALLGGAYLYYIRTSTEIANLRRNNEELTLAVETQKLTILHLQEDIAKVIQSSKELEQEKDKVIQDLDEQSKVLYRENRKKKSLEELALKKTKLIEKLVNNATGKVLSCFETLSNGGDC